MKMIKFLARPAFLVILVFSVTACAFFPGGSHGHGHGHGGGSSAGHK